MTRITGWTAHHPLVDPENDWMDKAACVDAPTRAFFADPGDSSVAPRTVAQYCDHCPVRQECLNYAVANNIKDGIWGGKTPRQRRLDRSDWWNRNRRG